MLYSRRPLFEKITLWLGRTFSVLKPNVITVFSLFTAVITFYFFANSMFAIAAFFLAMTAFLDMLDGAVARHRKEASPKGAYTDTITDRYTEFIIILPFFIVPIPNLVFSTAIWAVVYLFGSMMTTYAKSAAREKGIKDITGGLLERPERMLALLFALLAAHFEPLILSYAIALLAMLSNITALQRIAKALKNYGANRH